MYSIYAHPATQAIIGSNKSHVVQVTRQQSYHAISHTW